MKQRSIGYRIRRAKSPEMRLALLRDWSQGWRRDQEDIVRQFERALQTMDYGALCSATGQLKAVTDKLFSGLDSVIKHITTEEPD